MNRFRSRKSASRAASQTPSRENSRRPSVETMPSMSSFTFRRRKPNMPHTQSSADLLRTVNLAQALPTSDDLRTSLLLPNLCARFSMLKEQDDPESKIGKAADDSVLFHHCDALTASTSTLRAPDLLRTGSYASDDASVMNRARPGEGNSMFGGRQKIYKIPAAGTASSRTVGHMPGRAVYESDTTQSTFLRDQRRETSSSTNSVASQFRASTAATSVASQPSVYLSHNDMPPPPLLTSSSRSKRLYGNSPAKPFTQSTSSLHERYRTDRLRSEDDGVSPDSGYGPSLSSPLLAHEQGKTVALGRRQQAYDEQQYSQRQQQLNEAFAEPWTESAPDAADETHPSIDEQSSATPRPEENPMERSFFSLDATSEPVSPAEPEVKPGLDSLVRAHLRNISGQSSVYPEDLDSGTEQIIEVPTNLHPPLPSPLWFAARNLSATSLAPQDHHLPEPSGESGKLQQMFGNKAQRILGGEAPRTAGHTRGASTETQKEREALSQELAQRRRQVADNLQSYVDLERLGAMSGKQDESHADKGSHSLASILRSKAPTTSKTERPSKAMRMLGISDNSMQAAPATDEAESRPPSGQESSPIPSPIARHVPTRVVSRSNGSRKASINKMEISEPTFISSTASFDTVDLPPGASLKNGMAEVEEDPGISGSPMPSVRRKKALFSLNRNHRSAPSSNLSSPSFAPVGAREEGVSDSSPPSSASPSAHHVPYQTQHDMPASPAMF